MNTSVLISIVERAVLVRESDLLVPNTCLTFKVMETSPDRSGQVWEHVLLHS